MEVTNSKDAVEGSENNFRKARKLLKATGYATVQEALADTFIIGEVNKTQGTWKEVSDFNDIRTDRVIMNKAQAKHYGLEITDSNEQEGNEGEQPQQS